jgi:hypothetical protein
MNSKNFQLKDRVKLKDNSRKVKGTIVKLHYRDNIVKTCVVLWDNDWPKESPKHWEKPGRVFYLKPEDLKVVDNWRI